MALLTKIVTKRRDPEQMRLQQTFELPKSVALEGNEAWNLRYSRLQVLTVLWIGFCHTGPNFTVYSVSQKTSPTFLPVTRESIVGFS